MWRGGLGELAVSASNGEAQLAAGGWTSDEGRSLPLYDLEGVLGPTVIRFVERHVSSLLAWDILVFFHRNPEAVLDAEGLATRLGRRIEEIESEIDALCSGGILICSNGHLRYKPDSDLRDQVCDFVEACQDRGRRLALIALVLHRIGKTPSDA